MFDVFLGKEGLSRSYQAKFPESTECVHCHGDARIGFVAFESPPEPVPGSEPPRFVCDLHTNDPDGDGFWLHDCCAVAVYFCRKCLFPTSLYNQG